MAALHLDELVSDTNKLPEGLADGVSVAAEAQTPSEDPRRGGRVCIIANTTKVTISPLYIPTGNLEIVWALVKPIQESIIREILVLCFYLPPKSRMKSKMSDHIVTTLHHLLTRFPRAGIFGGGDRNDLDCDQILPAVPRLQNLQPLPTLNGKNLDVFISNLGPFYSNSIVVSAVDPDNPARGKRWRVIPFHFLL